MVLDSYDCILCMGGIEETLEHLFLEYICHRVLGIHWAQCGT
jgi:hypothetical protein